MLTLELCQQNPAKSTSAQNSFNLLYVNVTFLDIFECCKNAHSVIFAGDYLLISLLGHTFLENDLALLASIQNSKSEK